MSQITSKGDRPQTYLCTLHNVFSEMILPFKVYRVGHSFKSQMVAQRVAHSGSHTTGSTLSIKNRRLVLDSIMNTIENIEICLVP